MSIFKNIRILSFSIFLIIVTSNCNNHPKENNSKIECILFYLPNCIISEAKLVTFINIKNKYKSNNKINFSLVCVGKKLEESPNYIYQKTNNNLENIKIITERNIFPYNYTIKTVPYSLIIQYQKILYQGAIDDEYLQLNSKQKIKTNYFEDAIIAILENKDIKIKKTKAIGCKI